MPRIRSQLKPLALILIPVIVIGGAVLSYLVYSGTPGGLFGTRSKVGVINVSGTIEDFEYAHLADRARDDSSIKAVVLRINSTGGTVTGTFQAETSISKLALDKPVVADLEQYAASGAYVVASAADYIYAHEQTLTAGLGVIATWVSYKEYFENRGIAYYVWKTGEQKDMFAPWRKPTEEENAYIDNLVEDFADALFARVTSNRPETIGYIDNIRDGATVYGKHALELRLVDNLGNFEDAVERAAEMTGLEEGDYSTVNLSEYYKE